MLRAVERNSMEDPEIVRSVIDLLCHATPHAVVARRATFFHTNRQSMNSTAGLPQSATSLRAWFAIWFSWLAHIVLLIGLAHFLLEWISGLSN